MLDVTGSAVHSCAMSINLNADRTLSDLVAEEIRVAMARARIRQSELARRVGANDQWLSVRLRGVQPIDLNDLHKIAAALGTSASQIVAAAVDTKADTIGYPGDDEITHSERHGEPHLLTKSHLMRPRRPVRLTPRVA